jgi:hypothetical protein
MIVARPGAGGANATGHVLRAVDQIVALVDARLEQNRDPR